MANEYGHHQRKTLVCGLYPNQAGNSVLVELHRTVRLGELELLYREVIKLDGSDWPVYRILDFVERGLLTVMTELYDDAQKKGADSWNRPALDL